MKKISIIFIILLTGCSNTFFIKDSPDYPNTFVVDKKIHDVPKNEISLRYYTSTWGYYEYYDITIPYKKYKRKDIFKGDTFDIKPFLFNKYLKIKK